MADVAADPWAAAGFTETPDPEKTYGRGPAPAVAPDPVPPPPANDAWSAAGFQPVADPEHIYSGQQKPPGPGLPNWAIGGQPASSAPPPAPPAAVAPPPDEKTTLQDYNPDVGYHGQDTVPLTPEQKATVRDMPTNRIGQAIAEGGAKGFGSLSWQDALYKPFTTAIELPLRLGGALLGGAQGGAYQTARELGAPETLARDVAAAPEALIPEAPKMASAGGFGPDVRRVGDWLGSKLRGDEAPAAAKPAPGAPPPGAAPGAAPTPGANAAPQGTHIWTTDTGETPVTPTGVKGTEKESGKVYLQVRDAAGNTSYAPEDQVSPNSVGAMGTPTSQVPPLTRAERATYEIKQLNQQASERAPNGTDTTIYVKGSIPTRAAYEFHPENSNLEKALNATDTEFAGNLADRVKGNNEARIEHFNTLAADPIATQAMRDVRDAQKDIDLKAAFGNKKPVDPQAVVDTIDSLMSSGASKRAQVAEPLMQVRKSLFDKDGKLETDPEILYSARENLTDLLSKNAQREKPTLQLAAKHLQTVKDALDTVIEQGAPGYRQYLDNYSKASKPIDAMTTLQGYLTGPHSITDTNGMMQYGRVQRMMDSIVRQRTAPGANPAKNISDETMQQLFNLRNDLARDAYRDSLGRVKGSDTTQQASMAGRLGSGPLGAMIHGAADVATHAAIHHVTGPFGNLVFQNFVKPLVADHMAKRNIAANKELGRRLLEHPPTSADDIPTITVRPSINPATGLPEFSLHAAQQDNLVKDAVAHMKTHEDMQEWVTENKAALRKTFGGQGIQRIVRVSAMLRRATGDTSEPSTVFAVVVSNPPTSVRRALANVKVDDASSLAALAIAKPALADVLATRTTRSSLTKSGEAQVLAALKTSEGREERPEAGAATR